jgi:hypothetical protein
VEHHPPLFRSIFRVGYAENVLDQAPAITHVMLVFNPTHTEVHPFPPPDADGAQQQWLTLEEALPEVERLPLLREHELNESLKRLPRVRSTQKRVANRTARPGLSAWESRDAQDVAARGSPESGAGRGGAERELPRRTWTWARKLKTRAPNVAVVKLRKLARDISVEVHGRYERLDACQVIVVTEHQAALYQADSPTCTDTEWAVKPFTTGTLYGTFVTPEEYLRLVAEQIANLPAANDRAASSFFYELDKRTSAHFLHLTYADSEAEYQLYCEVTQLLFATLPQRLRLRKLEKQSGTPYWSGGYPGWLLKSNIASPNWFVALDAMENLFSTLLKTWFPAPQPTADGIDWAAYDAAFERFGAGYLRLQLPGSGTWTTQPSSGYYFLFGELALLCAELRWSQQSFALTDFWTKLANVMVRTQPIFCARYGPTPGPGRSMQDYSGCYFQDLVPPQAQIDDLIVQQRALTTGMDLAALSELAAQHAVDWLADE